MRTKEEVKRLRVEANRPLFKRSVYEAHGRSCVNCGSTESIELHHIVPLSVGGTNNISNIVPLCGKCHMGVHFAKKAWEESSRNAQNSHRPRTIEKIDDWEEIIKDYLRCRCGQKETREKLGMGKASHLSDAAWFKEYLKKNGVIGYRNNIDIIHSRRGEFHIGEQVGYLETVDSFYVYRWDGTEV